METEHRIPQFLADCTIRGLDDSDILPVADLYGMYIIWCEQHGADPLAGQLFSQAMRKEGLPAGISRKERVVKGVMATGPIPIQYILETDKAPGPNSPLGMLPG